MASAAAAMLDRGYHVTGSDHGIYEPMASFLASKKIPVLNGYDERHLHHRPDLVIIGNAISRGNPEAEYVLEQKLPYCSLPELLREFFIRGKRSLVVCGTHGKTTTTSLLAWVFEHNGLNPSYLIGGIPGNFTQGARFTDSEWFIIEGDEYDTAFFDKRSKFIHYQPELALINNLEFDHADIFENLESVRKAFSHLIRLVPRNGLLLANGDDPRLAPLLNISHCPVKQFGLGGHNAIRAFNLQLGPTASSFETPSFRFRLDMVGELNVRNALGVVAAAKHCGLSNRQIQSAFDSFKGIRRRMEIKGIAGGVTVIDDFGHHPTAIRETLKALRLRYPTEKIHAIFEPRSNSTRRKVFQQDLAESFSDADSVVVAQVARLDQLAPEERLDPDQLIGQIQAHGKPAHHLPDVQAIVNHLAHQAGGGDVVVTFSNGSFDAIHSKLLARLKSR